MFLLTHETVRVRVGLLPMDRDNRLSSRTWGHGRWTHPSDRMGVQQAARRICPNGLSRRPPARPSGSRMIGFMAARIPIILDCDPGHDDALAITLALARPELELLALTTVAGNAPLEATTRNALRVLTLLGRTDVPVGRGAPAPLVRPLHVAVNVHGESGLDGADLPEPALDVQPVHAIELIRTVIERSPVPVTLVPTGPLTNIALLLRTYPRLIERIDQICLMGGSVGEGNTTASAEFNIWADPEAAEIVFQAGRPVTMIGLDVTHQAIVTADDAERMARLGNRTGQVFAGLLEFFGRFHRTRYGWDGSPVHDAVAVAHLAVPGLVETEPCRVDVETSWSAHPGSDGRRLARPDRSAGECPGRPADRSAALRRPAGRGRFAVPLSRPLRRCLRASCRRSPRRSGASRRPGPGGPRPGDPGPSPKCRRRGHGRGP